MITEQQQEQASLFALGMLQGNELAAFEAQLRVSPELQALTRDLQRAADLVAVGAPQVALPPSLRDKVLQRIAAQTAPNPGLAKDLAGGLRFMEAAGKEGWKQLPVPGAYVKLLSVERERGYAILLGKLDAGVRYPAHRNVGPESFYVLTGDLVVGSRKLVAGDFHQADAGSEHEVNYSVDGCTLIAVLTTDDPLVAYAMV